MNTYDVIMIGPACIDEYYNLKGVPEMGDKVLCDFIGNKLGGMISNAAVIIASYGLPTALIDSVSHSANSKDLIKGLEDYHVGIDLLEIDDRYEPGKCIILLHNGERSILVVSDKKYGMEFTEEQKTALAQCKVLYTTIVDLQRYKESFPFMEELKRKGIKIVYDVEGSTIQDPPTDLEYLKLADLIFVNEGGTATLEKTFGNYIVAKLVDQGIIVVETLGSHGCKVFAKDHEVITSPAAPADPVDTTGAGDTFNTTFVYGYLEHWDLEKCAIVANGAAGRSILEIGPRSGACGMDAVKQFMSTYQTDSH